MDDKDDIKKEQQLSAEAAKEDKKKTRHLTEAIREQAREEDTPPSASYTLRKILGGDFLTADVMRRQIGVIILVAFLTMIYVSNRYSCQQDLLEINELQKELKDAKYKALADKEKNVIFGGRLGQYKYYDMDKVIAAALDCVEKELGVKAN